MLNFLLWMLAGGALGFAASRLLRQRVAAGTLLNILAGTVGGFMSGLVIKSALAVVDPEMARLSLWALLAALAGAGLLLVVVNLPARRRAAVERVEQVEGKPAA